MVAGLIALGNPVVWVGVDVAMLTPVDDAVLWATICDGNQLVSGEEELGGAAVLAEVGATAAVDVTDPGTVPVAVTGADEGAGPTDDGAPDSGELTGAPVVADSEGTVDGAFEASDSAPDVTAGADVGAALSETSDVTAEDCGPTAADDASTGTEAEGSRVTAGTVRLGTADDSMTGAAEVADGISEDDTTCVASRGVMAETG